jgi:hypothetical protein
MTDDYKEKEVLKVPEKRNEPENEWSDFGKERIKSKEEKIVSVDENRVADQLRQEIELMDLDDKLKEEAKNKASKIDFLGEKEKIEHLLKIAREQGIVLAIKTAKETGDPYLLDVLHDILAREGFYKTMTKTTDDDGNDDNKN